MKLIHLSDLHIGKRLHEFSLLEDQIDILDKIIAIIQNEKPDGVILAGDIYDKAVPSAEAVRVFDRFLTALAELQVQIYMISGNHDSAERLSFGAKLMENNGIHIAPIYDGSLLPISGKDEYGSWNIYLLPFIKPAQVRNHFPDAVITDYTQALQTVMEHLQPDVSARNILVTHQFVTGASRSDSEELSVGGTDNVDATVFADFDYVALGHIHGPQNIQSPKIRYCGTPLKYSFSEAEHQKSLTVVTLKEKGNIKLTTIPLIPKRDLRILRGSYRELCMRDNYKNTNTDDYIQVILTDEEEVLNAVANLKIIYPNLMNLLYDNARTRNTQELFTNVDVKSKTPLELFGELYEQQNKRPPNEKQWELLRTLIAEISEEGNV